MFNIDEILAELAAGKSIEEIAQNAADVLNAAKAQHDKQEAERKAREEAARKEEEKKKAAAALQKKRKANSATAIMNSMFDFMDEFYPGFFSPKDIADFHRGFDAEAFVDAIDETVKMIKELPSVDKALAEAGDRKNVSVKLTKEEEKELEDAIQKFLKENGLF